MLNVIQINNQTDVTVYTCPTGKKAFIFVDVFPVTPIDVTIKVNGVVYWSGSSVADQISAKMVLSGGDVVSVSSSGQVNVFVHGQEI